jgi:hypothetical protein
MATTRIPEVSFRTIDGIRIRHADSGGSPKPTVLLTSPWPESVYAFAPTWVSLSEHARLETIEGGVPDDSLADYLACYDGDRFAESMRYVRRYPEELPELAGLLPRITVPVTIINGRHDRVVPLANAEFLDQRLPTSRLVIIDAGHFVWEEEPARYASAVIDSITGSWL